MESEAKRRKLDRGDSGLRHGRLIDFESRTAAQVSTASTFVLQTDELLREARVDNEKSLKYVDEQLIRLKTAVDSIEHHDPLPIAEATAKLEKQHRIAVPYPEPRPSNDSPYKVAYSRPSHCNVVGSYVSKTMVKSQSAMGIDMVAQMPASLFQEKDYLSLRYFYRRAYFIAYIAAHVRKEMDNTMSCTFDLLHENPLLPVLVLWPSSEAAKTTGRSKERNGGMADKNAKKKSSYFIRLIPCAPDTLFPWSKVRPSANCTRLGDSDGKEGDIAASPFYNSTLNAERTFIQYLRVLTQAQNECSAFSDACVLGRIWLQQRGFGSSVSDGGFGHFEWSTMVALLMKKGGGSGQPALSSSLSSTELFKAAIHFLSNTDLMKRPFAFHTADVDEKSIQETGPVMFDPARQLNILYKMTPWSAGLLQIYAKSTSDLLADEGADNFHPTFIIKADVTLQVFDTVLQINAVDLSRYDDSPDRSSNVCKFGSEVHKILKKALGNRAQLVHVKLPPSASWPLSAPCSNTSSILAIGIIHDPAHMARQMEYGPPAEEVKEAAAFRHFWGSKAELRRFKDGSILECIEWSSKGPGRLCAEIAAYSLNRHLKVAKEEIISCDVDPSSFIGLSHADKEAFDLGLRAFATFEKDIRKLHSLPLQIRQLSPVSPLARYSSAEPPSLGFYHGFIESMDVNLFFEASSKWPENLTAIQEAKVEFLLDFDRRLNSANGKLTTCLGRENRDVGTENLAYLDVVYPDGAAFRLRIFCDLEQTLLQRQVQNKTLDHHIRHDAAQALSSFNWQYTILPLHTQTIATSCTRLQPLSHSIRLVKHWFNSHKLSGHFSEEVIELFVLHVFLQPYPWARPSSATSGFLRTLSFLSRWDWRVEPLVVDSAGSMTSDDRSSLRRELESWRRRDPHMNSLVMLVATSADSSGAAYTHRGPSHLIASRMTRLSKAACHLVRQQGLGLEPSSLFETCLDDFDVLIHLSTKAIKNVLGEAATVAASGARNHRSPYKNLDDRTGRPPLPIRVHPSTALLQELERAYRDSLIFFPGRPDDPVLAAIWSPRLQHRQRFRTGLPYNFHSAQFDGPDDVVQVNRRAILLEIARAGGELIRKIEVTDGGA